MNAKTQAGLDNLTEHEKFRASVSSLFWFEFPCSFLVFLCAVSLAEGSRFSWDTIPFGLIVILPFAWLVSWLLSRFFTTVISPDGIRGHSFWGIRRSIRWRDIGRAKTFWLLNLRFLRLYSTRDGQVTWIALYPARKEDFYRAIQRFAPADHLILNIIGR